MSVTRTRTFSSLVGLSHRRLQAWRPRVTTSFTSRARFVSLFRGWKAAHVNSTVRSQRGDIYDPCALACADGVKAREAREQIAINMKTGAMPKGCGTGLYSRQMKMEFPEAPQPIIGMSDLRAQKGH